MNIRHTVTLEEITRDKVEIELAGCYCGGSNKSLKARVVITPEIEEDSFVRFVVYENREQVNLYSDITEAILRYNNLD